MKIRISIVLLSFLASCSVFGQRKIEPTNSFKITGKIKSEKIFSLKQLDSFPKQNLKDQIIYNHKGEIKDTIKNAKGVLLKTVLEKIEFSYEKPKDLNEFYFVFVASDGYKVVFSWNEIYNTEVGNNLFIITAIESKKLTEMEQRILVSSIADIKSGRRYIKGLTSVEVKKIE